MKMKNIKTGSIFYLYQDSKKTKLVLMINKNELMCLEDGIAGEIITDFDLENEAEEPIISDVYNYS